VSKEKCYSLWGENNIGWLHNEGVEGAGSMLTMWHKEAFSYVNHMKGKGFIAVMGKHIKSKANIMVVNVYASCNVGKLSLLIQRLKLMEQLVAQLIQRLKP